MRSAAEAELASRERKPCRGKNLGKPRGLVLSRILGGVSRRLLVERSLVETRQAWGASTSLESLDRLGEPRQAWRARSLAKIRLKSLMGPGRPARGTLVSTVPTSTGGDVGDGVCAGAKDAYTAYMSPPHYMLLSPTTSSSSGWTNVPLECPSSSEAIHALPTSTLAYRSACSAITMPSQWGDDIEYSC